MWVFVATLVSIVLDPGARCRRSNQIGEIEYSRTHIPDQFRACWIASLRYSALAKIATSTRRLAS